MTADDHQGNGGTVDEGPSGIARWIPGLNAVRTYDRRWARSDIVAGVVLAAILVPQGLAYAELAGLPPVTGLYTSIGCLVGYAVFGPSRILVLGPDSSISPLIFAALLPLLAAGGTPIAPSRWPGCSRSSSPSSKSDWGSGSSGSSLTCSRARCRWAI